MSVAGHYSLIQYCPDRSRMETVNVGVVLVSPQIRYVGVRTSIEVDRIRGFFSFELLTVQRLAVTLHAMEYHINTDKPDTPGSLERLADSWGNDLLLTKPRPILFDQSEAELDRLFNELVLPPPGSTAAHAVISTPARHHCGTRPEARLAP